MRALFPSLFLFAVAVLPVACVGSDDGPTTVADSGAPSSDSGSPGTDSGAPGTDSGSPGTDSGSPSTDSGTGPKFLCGLNEFAVSCTLGSTCCVSGERGSCAGTQGCDPGATPFTPGCTTSADCAAPGEACCAEFNGNTLVRTVCKGAAACANSTGRIACQLDRSGQCPQGQNCASPTGGGYGFGICQ